MSYRRLIASTLGLAALAACAKPPAPLDTAGIQAAIEKQEASYDGIFKSKDPVALAALYTEDATWILPDGSVFVGRAAIAEGAKGFFTTFESGAGQPVVTDAFFVVDSANAVIFAHMPYTVRMKGAKKDTEHINYFATHWRKGADGVWLAHHDLNVDAPVKPAAPAKAAAPAKKPAKPPAKKKP